MEVRCPSPMLLLLGLSVFIELVNHITWITCLQSLKEVCGAALMCWFRPFCLKYPKGVWWTVVQVSWELSYAAIPSVQHRTPSVQHIYEAVRRVSEEVWAMVSSVCRWYPALCPHLIQSSWCSRVPYLMPEWDWVLAEIQLNEHHPGENK